MEQQDPVCSSCDVPPGTLLRRYSRRVAVTLERVDPMQEHQPKIAMQIRANPAAVADPGKVRIGGESPSFGPVR